MNQQYYCIDCSCHCSDQNNLIDHIIGRKHLDICASRGTWAWCAVCRRWHDSNLNDHLSGRRHNREVNLGIANGPAPPPPTEVAMAAGKAIEMLRAEILALGGTIPSATTTAPIAPVPVELQQPMAMYPIAPPDINVTSADQHLQTALYSLPSIIAVIALIAMWYAK